MIVPLCLMTLKSTIKCIQFVNIRLISNLDKFVKLTYASFAKNRIKFMQAETISNKIIPQLEFIDFSYNFLSPNLSGFTNKNMLQGIFEHILAKAKVYLYSIDCKS